MSVGLSKGKMSKNGYNIVFFIKRTTYRRKYDSYRNLCFSSHINGNWISINNTRICFASFFKRSIIFNNKWNQGILHCAPLYFCSTFHTMISGNAPLSSKTWAFRCLPFEISCYPQLTKLRDAIQT